ncbi:14014_t:CDS:2 [Entrophospora sp. SA101]|nr:14014_t:CDS:2 [Entrophospora sp. SA101]
MQDPITAEHFIYIDDEVPIEELTDKTMKSSIDKLVDEGFEDEYVHVAGDFGGRERIERFSFDEVVMAAVYNYFVKMDTLWKDFIVYDDDRVSSKEEKVIDLASSLVSKSIDLNDNNNGQLSVETVNKLEYCEAMIQEVGLAIQQNEADWKDAKAFNLDRFRGSDRTIKEHSLMVLVTD